MTETAASIVVEPMTAADLAAVRPLLAVLGYDIDTDELARRFSRVADVPDHAVFVARAHAVGPAVGLIHVYVRAALEKPVEAYVQSLAVADGWRGQGIGKRLTDAAETWARDRGLGSMALHTQRHRDGAFRFYSREGYAEITQSRMLRKRL